MENTQNAAEASAEETTPICTCCQLVLHDPEDPDVPVKALTCGHVFHEECLKRWMTTCATDLEDVPCPLCKLNAGAVDELALRPGAPALPQDALRPVARPLQAAEPRIVPFPGPALPQTILTYFRRAGSAEAVNAGSAEAVNARSTEADVEALRTEAATLARELHADIANWSRIAAHDAETLPDTLAGTAADARAVAAAAAEARAGLQRAAPVVDAAPLQVASASPVAVDQPASAPLAEPATPTETSTRTETARAAPAVASTPGSAPAAASAATAGATPAEPAASAVMHPPAAPATEVPASPATVPAASVTTPGEQAAPEQPEPTGSMGFDINTVDAWAKPDHTVTCNLCKSVCSLERAKLYSKSQGTFHCPKCMTTMMQIHRANGSTKGLINTINTQIPEDTRKQFFAEAADLKPGEVVQLYDRMLKKYESHETTYSLGGQFLPLSVWVQKGYDGQAILDNSLPRDIRDDRMFSKVYRVPILAIYEQGKKGSKSHGELKADGELKIEVDDDHGMLPAPERKKRPLAGGSVPAGQRTRRQPSPEVAAGRQDTWSDSDSDSSSHSSMSSGALRKMKQKKRESKEAEKKKKKERKAKKREQKEAKKERKTELDRARSEKAAQRAAEMTEKKARANSKATATKLDKALTGMERTLRLNGHHLVPEALVRPFKDSITRLQVIQQAAGLHAEGGADFTTPVDIDALIKHATKLQGIHAGHVKNFLAASVTS